MNNRIGKCDKLVRGFIGPGSDYIMVVILSLILTHISTGLKEGDVLNAANGQPIHSFDVRNPFRPGLFV